MNKNILPFIRVKSKDIQDDYCEIVFLKSALKKLGYSLIFTGYNKIIEELNTKKWKNDHLVWEINDGKIYNKWTSISFNKKSLDKKIKK